MNRLELAGLETETPFDCRFDVPSLGAHVWRGTTLISQPPSVAGQLSAGPALRRFRHSLEATKSRPLNRHDYR